MKNQTIQAQSQNSSSSQKKNHTFILKSHQPDESILDKNISTKSMSRHRQIEQLMKDFSTKNNEESNRAKKSGQTLIYSANFMKISNNKFANLSSQQLQKDSSVGLSISNSSANQEYQSFADQSSNVNSQSFMIGSNLQHSGHSNHQKDMHVQLPLILNKAKYAPFQKSSIIPPIDSTQSINFSTIGKSNKTSSMMFEHLNSNKSSNMNLQKHS